MKRNQADLLNRIMILESLGFVVEHEDSRVSHPAILDVNFDFSAIDNKMFVYHALRTVQSSMFVKGRNSLRAQFNTLMEIEE